MNKNVLCRAQLTWKVGKPDDQEEANRVQEEREGFMTAWRSVVQAKTTQDLHTKWQDLRHTYQNQPQLLDYLKTWWEVQESWPHAHLCKVRHFGST